MFVEGMVNHWQHLGFKLEPYIAIPCSSKFPMCVLFFFFLQDVPGSAMNREVSMMFEAQDILIFRTNCDKLCKDCNSRPDHSCLAQSPKDR